MVDKVRFNVLREHEGDRAYKAGETREGTMAELGHLVGKVLAPIDDAPVDAAQAGTVGAKVGEKAEPDAASANKAERVLSNKAERAPAKAKNSGARKRR